MATLLGARGRWPAGGPAPVLLDVRWRLGGPPGIDRYREGHLPGARFVDLDRDLAGPARGRADAIRYPDAAPFQAAMRRAGVSDGQPVVVYDESDSMAAARAWWLLRYFGHQQVQVLDGGYQAWLAADQPIETGPAAGRGGRRRSPPGPGHLPLLDAAARRAWPREGVLLDARAAERYRGEVEPADPVAGHIPGAVSAPTTGNSPPGRPLPAARLSCGPGSPAWALRPACTPRAGRGGGAAARAAGCTAGPG